MSTSDLTNNIIESGSQIKTQKLFQHNKKNEDLELETEEASPWELQDFDIGDCLGNGKFGYVYRAKEKRNNKEVALKVICKNIVSQFNFYDQLKNEIEIHSRLIHKNIVRMYGYFYDNSYVYLVYECLKKGNLFQYMKNIAKLNEEEAAKFTYEIALSLNYLKKRNIIHRDLKLENVMLSEDESGGAVFLKLADFGWACQYFTELRTTLCGTPEYLAPEMVNSRPYDFQVDVWSLGIMTFEMVTGYSPFAGNESDILNKIKNHERLDSIISHLNEVNASDDLISFISSILVADHIKRIKIEEVINHPWIINNINILNRNL